jgi:pectinesterase
MDADPGKKKMIYRNLYINTLRFLLLALTILLATCILAQQDQKIILVDLNCKGDYRSIQGAINSLEDSSAIPRIIHIKNGVYREKIYLEKHNIILKGEDRGKTIITQQVARDEWRCLHNDDWGVATVNIDGNDISLLNLTIANDYGFNNQDSKTVYCKNDTVNRYKTITNKGHQMALRSFSATRLQAINCHFRSYAGDTVSPWNTVEGMFYFRDCIMEGGVDLYCPRGYAWAENCSFYASRGDAAIWHDGSGNKDHKTVLVNCRFDGFAGFNLGRYHRDAQFFLVDCEFSKNMSDRDIFQVPTSNQVSLGRRVYYKDCKRATGNFPWFNDNLERMSGLNKNDITVKWLFGDKWSPGNN